MESSPKASFAFYQEKNSSLKKTDLKDMFKEASNNACASTVVVPPDIVSPTPSTSAIQTPENTKQDPYDPEPADEGDDQVQYSSNYSYSSSIVAVTKNYL